jgi:hypothetical protein
MKYTAEEVRAIAKRLHDDITVADGDALMASDMLTDYAERIEADEVANDRIDFKGMWNAMSDRAYAHPPAQAAQGETACPKCGATNPEDAATRCCPDGDSCPGCEEPLAQAWDRKAAQPAQSVDVAKVREVIAHLRSFRSNTPPTWAHLDDAADKLEAALPESKP